ncbi:hypothetical protein MOQ_006420 [Trypanosoma cruzi marinkellei]|uniref:Protein kinase domain-containing protein n=1 Tax=Trypanosoma cruzi marinkellei TaxID=85056 RepID=K2N519_TRYCR|nr:hypothetical protein MOQ_006420 [Trypanosoma cruzi marinkellei]
MQTQSKKKKRRSQQGMLFSLLKTFPVPTSPANSLHSTDEMLRTRGSAKEVSVGGGFRCRLLDEPFNGVQWAPVMHREMDFGGNPHLSVSHTDDQRIRLPHPMQSFGRAGLLNRAPTPVHLAVSFRSPTLMNIFDMYAGTPPMEATTIRAHTMTAGAQLSGGMERNIRCGSKIVCGYTDDTKMMCAVRVFLVDKVMLKKLKELVAPSSFFSSPLTSEHGFDGTRDSVASKTTGRLSVELSVSNPSLFQTMEEDNKNDGNGRGNDNESLSNYFFWRLQQGLEEAFLRPLEKGFLDVPSEDAADDKSVWICSPSFARSRHLSKNTEITLSTEDSVSDSLGKTEEEDDEACVTLSPPTQSVEVSGSADVGSVADSSHKAIAVKDVVGQNTTSDGIHSNDTVKFGDKKRIDVGNAVEWQLPIVGVRVVSLNPNGLILREEGRSTSLMSSKRRRTNMAATTVVGANSNVSQRRRKPVLCLGENPTRRTQRVSRHPSKLTGVSSGLENLPRSCCTGKAIAATSLSGLTRVKKGKRVRVDRTKTGTSLLEATQVDMKTSKEHDRTAGLMERLEAASPLFAIALSLPLVRQGNIHEVFQDWIRTQRPSQLLRETAIRNIIHAVLQHLVVLHRKGRAHGSIKATNIFFTSHVMEALNAMKSHSPNPTDPIPVSTGMGNTTRLWSGVKLDTNEVGEGQVDAVSRSRSNSPSGGSIGGDEGGGIGAGGGGCSRSTEVSDPLEWTKHVVLADGYYAEVEKALKTSLSESLNTTALTSVVRSNSAPLHLAKVLDSTLPFEDMTPEDAGEEMDALQLFVLQEEEYIPPPECITTEGGMTDVTSLEAKHTSVQPESKNASGMGSAFPFRKTNNTRNPLCPCSFSHDIWMLAMLAIHLADGGCPWWMKRHHRPLPRLRCGQWSVRFAAFVQRCACADPAQRPSAEELLKDKWFHTALLEEKKEVITPSPPPAPSQQVLLGGSNTFILLRRSCRRAFYDIMLEYNEYAEDWCTRFSQAATVAAKREKKDDFPHPTSNQSGSFAATTAVDEAPELSMTNRTEQGCSGLFFSPNDNSNKNSSCSISRSSHSSNSTRTDSLVSRSGNSDNMSETSPRGRWRSPSGFAGGTDSPAVDGHLMPSRQTAPFFLGAVGVALELCGDEASPDAGDAETETCRGSSSRKGGGGGVAGKSVGGSNYSPPRQGRPPHSSPFLDATLDSCEEHQRIIGEFLQAFWNLHRECRLAADLWCVSLLKHMRLDGRTAELVFPLITEETMPFFAVSDGEMYSMAHGRSSTAHIPGPTAAAAAAATTSLQEGVASSAAGKTPPSPSQQQRRTTASIPPVAAVATVSPTAFHNYMFCKWCVTTSWALQQDGRGGGNEGKR